MPYKIAILGASGYTGAELVRLIATHPDMEIAALSADRKAGMEMAEVFPFLRPGSPSRRRRYKRRRSSRQGAGPNLRSNLA